jgi:uncharacterized protein (DUF427 family)
MKAIWNNQVLAESSETIVVESNHYFPASSINSEFFQECEAKTFCPWKGEANYYNIVVDNVVNNEAAWHYPETKDKASHIKGMVAFWRGVEVTE